MATVENAPLREMEQSYLSTRTGRICCCLQQKCWIFIIITFANMSPYMNPYNYSKNFKLCVNLLMTSQ